MAVLFEEYQLLSPLMSLAYPTLNTTGTRGFESEEKDRPQFQGDKDEPVRRSFVNNRKETYFPDSKRTCLSVYSFVSIFFAIAFVGAFFGATFYAEYLVTYKYPLYEFPYFEWGVMSFIAIMIEVFSHLYLGFSAVLADSENHRTETNHEDSLIAKTVFFKIFNHYGAVIFTLFGKGPLLGDETTRSRGFNPTAPFTPSPPHTTCI